MSPTNEADPSPKEIADQVAKNFFRVGSRKTLNRAAIQGFLIVVITSVALGMLRNYVRFGYVSNSHWATAIFLVGICTLGIIRLRFRETDTDRDPNRAVVRDLLIGAVMGAVYLPLRFYLRFGYVPGFGWGATIFLVTVCILAAIGLYFRQRTEYHSPVPLRGDWVDKIGAFWLVSCAFGPLLGWIITSVFPITLSTWRWLYMTRVFFAVALPVITALPMIRYLRGEVTFVALSLLVIITLLPIFSAVNVSRDLWAGPITRQVQSIHQPELYLRYTGKSLDIGR